MDWAVVKIKHPPKGDIWWHVDQLQRDDLRVWAIQWHDGTRFRYECVKSVICTTMAFTQFHGATAKQPKAVIVIPKGTVRICDDFAYIN